MSIVYFIGVTTGKFSIMEVFPEWMKHPSVAAKIKRIGFVPHDEPQRYWGRYRSSKGRGTRWRTPPAGTAREGRNA